MHSLEELSAYNGVLHQYDRVRQRSIAGNYDNLSTPMISFQCALTWRCSGLSGVVRHGVMAYIIGGRPADVQLVLTLLSDA